MAITDILLFAWFQITFEAILERGYQGDIAIDDISVLEGACWWNSQEAIFSGKKLETLHDITTVMFWGISNVCDFVYFLHQYVAAFSRQL